MHRLTLLFKILKIFRTVGPPADRSITKAAVAVVDAVAVAAEPEMPFGVFANVRGAAPSLKAVQSQTAVQVHWQLLHKQARWHTHTCTYIHVHIRTFAYSQANEHAWAGFRARKPRNSQNTP